MLFLIFLPFILSPVSRKSLLSISLRSLFFNSFEKHFSIVLADDIVFLIGESNILDGLNRNPPNGTILSNWVFKKFILADKRF